MNDQDNYLQALQEHLAADSDRPPQESPLPPGTPPVQDKPTFKRAYVIANPASGQDRPFLGILNKAFKDAGMEWELKVTKGAGDGLRFAREAVAEGADVVAAYGGDGTVMEVANGLFGTGIPLAIFPGGTANVMSVELGIPGDLAAAAALITGSESVIRTVDMGQVGDLRFMLRISIGFSAEMTKGADRDFKNRAGTLAYTLSALRELPNAQSAHYRLTLDGEAVEIDGLTCIVANSGNIGVPGVKLIPTMDVSDGLLDVVMLQAINLGSVVTFVANAAGIVESLPHWQAKEVKVEADPPQTVECDGEILPPTPLTARIIPRAMLVVVPRAAIPAAAAAPSGEGDYGG